MAARQIHVPAENPTSDDRTTGTLPTHGSLSIHHGDAIGPHPKDQRPRAAHRDDRALDPSLPAAELHAKPNRTVVRHIIPSGESSRKAPCHRLPKEGGGLYRDLRSRLGPDVGTNQH